MIRLGTPRRVEQIIDPHPGLRVEALRAPRIRSLAGRRAAESMRDKIRNHQHPGGSIERPIGIRRIAR